MKLNIPTIQVLENEMKIHNIDGKRAKYLWKVIEEVTEENVNEMRESYP